MPENSTKIKHFQNLGRKRVCLTAYTARLAELLAPHVDLLLVGDSLSMVLYGMDDTRGVSLAQMINHGKAVRNGAGGDALVIVDMPYGTYEDGDKIALKNAQDIMRQTECDGIKLEGGANLASRIKTLTQDGIPVMGHIGLLPQSAPDEGGYKIKGRTEDQIEALIQDAKAVEAAGAFAFVLEGTIEETARRVVEAVSIPVIGIGASPACDGQILVSEDMLGLTARPPKFVKAFGDMTALISNAAAEYAAEVKNETFPGPEHVYRNIKK